MPTLRELQEAFGRAIFADDGAIAEHVVADGIAAADRVRVYRHTAFAVSIEALRLTYPAIGRIVGNAFFDAAARRFVAATPPVGACLAEYGAGFAEFLAAFPPASSLPYLPDVARFEWALAEAANAPDAPALTPAGLAALEPEAHACLRFAPHPSLRLLHLRYPADAIADAVLSGDDAAMAAIDLADGPIRLAIHRGPAGVTARRLAPAEWRFTRRLIAGDELAAVLGAFPALDAAPLLADHLTAGRFADTGSAR